MPSEFMTDFIIITLKRVVAEKQEKRNQERLKRREEREREEREKLRRYVLSQK
jgi:hypothetical protein